METKYFKILSNDQLSCATKFDEKVDFAKRIELKELLKMNGYQLIEITEEEYDKIPRKLDAI